MSCYHMHTYRTNVHESTGNSPFRLMMGEECSLPQDVSTAELRTHREHDISLHRTAPRRKRLYDIKAVNRKFPVGSNQVIRQATGHTVGIQYLYTSHGILAFLLLNYYVLER